MKIIKVRLITSETLQAMPIKFAVKFVRLKVYTICSIRWPWPYPRSELSIKLDTFLTCTIIVIYRTIFKLCQTCHDGRLCMACFMLVSMTVTLMQGSLGLAEEKLSVQLSRQVSKQYTCSVKFCFIWPWLWKHVYDLTCLFLFAIACINCR